MGKRVFSRFFFLFGFFFLEFGIGKEGELDEVGVVEGGAFQKMGEIFGIGDSVSQLGEKSVNQECVFGFVPVLVDEGSAEKESEAVGNSFGGDFGPIELELV